MLPVVVARVLLSGDSQGLLPNKCPIAIPSRSKWLWFSARRPQHFFRAVKVDGIIANCLSLPLFWIRAQVTTHPPKLTSNPRLKPSTTPGCNLPTPQSMCAMAKRLTLKSGRRSTPYPLHMSSLPFDTFRASRVLRGGLECGGWSLVISERVMQF